MTLSQLGDVKVPSSPEDWLELVGVIATKLVSVLPTEQDHWWFLVEQFDRSAAFGPNAKAIMAQSPIILHEIEYEGRRSENSYVGHANSGVLLLQSVKSGLEAKFGIDLAEVVLCNVYVSYAIACIEPLNTIRNKYAVHFYNNCVSSHSYNNAELWDAVIESISES